MFDKLLDRPAARSRASVALAPALAVLPFVLAAMVPVEPLAAATREDGLVEGLGALAWFAAAVLFAAAAMAYRKSAPSTAPGTFWRSALALTCLIAAGEEISWGQRLFDYDTPAVVAERNLQKEMNLHNLAVLDTRLAESREEKSGLSRWLTFGRLGSLIWMGYLVALPLLVRFSAPLDRLAARVQLPVSPLAVAVAGALAYGTFVMVFEASGPIRRFSVNEIKESIVAVLFLCSAYAVFRRRGRAPHPLPGRRDGRVP